MRAILRAHRWWYGTKSVGFSDVLLKANGFAVPALIFELLAQELTGQCVVRFSEIRAEARILPLT
jgi:hypothetical protein